MSKPKSPQPSNSQEQRFGWQVPSQSAPEEKRLQSQRGAARSCPRPRVTQAGEELRVLLLRKGGSEPGLERCYLGLGRPVAGSFFRPHGGEKVFGHQARGLGYQRLLVVGQLTDDQGFLPLLLPQRDPFGVGQADGRRLSGGWQARR